MIKKGEFDVEDILEWFIWKGVFETTVAYELYARYGIFEVSPEKCERLLEDYDFIAYRHEVNGEGYIFLIPPDMFSECW